MKNKLIGIALVVALVVTGGLLGAVIDRTWVRDDAGAGKSVDHRRPGRGKRHERLMRRFRKRLKLTDEQAAAVSKILTESRAKMRGMRKQAREDIKKVLNPDQLEKYERMLERRRKRRRGRRGRRR